MKTKLANLWVFVKGNAQALFVAGVVLALLIACAKLYIHNTVLQNTLDGATILTGPVTVQTPCPDSLR